MGLALVNVAFNVAGILWHFTWLGFERKYVQQPLIGYRGIGQL